MYSAMPNGDHVNAAEESSADSVDSEYAEDNEDGDEESKDSDYEVQPPPRSEQRSKMRQDPAANPGITLASSSGNPKLNRPATPESTEKAAKQPKPSAPKPRKA